jgi:hypothetical protein
LARKPTHAGLAIFPATVGAPRVSHPLCALTAPCAFRACFIPDPPVGFHPSGPSPFAEPWHLSMPAALLTFPRHHPRPTDHNGETLSRLRVVASPAPCSARDQAPQSADPSQPPGASIARSTRMAPHGASSPRPLRIADPGCRSPNNGEAAFRAFLPAKSPVPSVGCYADSEADALMGFTSPGLSGVVAGIDVFPPPSPLGLCEVPPAFDRGCTSCPSGSCHHEPGRSSCEAHRPS